MTNHVSGRALWDVVFELARAAETAVMPVGCRTSVTEPGLIDELPAGSPRAAPAPGQAQQVIPSPLPAGQGVEALARRGPDPAKPAVPQPPPPDLGTQRPTPPPNTMSLERLHQQGKTHVLR